MSHWELLFIGIVGVISFAVSASAGLGGSLVLVPALAAVLGTKEGVALAALLLAANNVAKVVAYRNDLPFRRTLVVIGPTVAGAWIGASLFAAAPERLVTIAAIVSIAATLAVELVTDTARRPIGVPAFAGAAGVTSGFSGTSGPLKGIAVRGLGLSPAATVGAATLASLSGDVTKTIAFASDGYLGGRQAVIAATMVPLMVLGTALGRRFNRRLGSDGYMTWFWIVMSGYTLRLAGVFG